MKPRTVGLARSKCLRTEKLIAIATVSLPGDTKCSTVTSFGGSSSVGTSGAVISTFFSISSVLLIDGGGPGGGGRGAVLTIGGSEPRVGAFFDCDTVSCSISTLATTKDCGGLELKQPQEMTSRVLSHQVVVPESGDVACIAFT